MPMTDEEKAAYYPYIVDTVTFDGTQWGVPVAFSTKALYWNKDLFKQRRARSREAAEDLGRRNRGRQDDQGKDRHAGFGVVAKTFDNTMHQFLHWVYTNNGSVIDADGNITLDSPQKLAALTASRTSSPYSEEGPTAYEQNEVRAIFLDGKVGMIQAASSAAPTCLKEADRSTGASRRCRSAPQAKGPGTLLITDSLAVFKGTGVEDKAIEFAKFITSPEIQPIYEMQGSRPDAAAAVARSRRDGGGESALEAVHRRHRLSADRSRCSPTTRASRTP